jgi:hypothetical protein
MDAIRSWNTPPASMIKAAIEHPAIGRELVAPGDLGKINPELFGRHIWLQQAMLQSRAPKSIHLSGLEVPNHTQPAHRMHQSKVVAPFHPGQHEMKATRKEIEADVSVESALKRESMSVGVSTTGVLLCCKLKRFDRSQSLWKSRL